MDDDDQGEAAKDGNEDQKGHKTDKVLQLGGAVVGNQHQQGSSVEGGQGGGQAEGVQGGVDCGEDKKAEETDKGLQPNEEGGHCPGQGQCVQGGVDDSENQKEEGTIKGLQPEEEGGHGND